MRLPIFLDTGPGINGTVAIAAAIFTPELDLQPMTIVAGNVSVEKTTRNALQLLHFWNVDIPPTQGTAVPLVRAPHDAAPVHGESGMADYDFVEHGRQPLDIPAFLATRDVLMHAPELVTLVVIGPLTNVALLLSQCPKRKPYVCRPMVMGSSVDRGNRMPNTELNIIADSKAAAYVSRSGIKIVMCGLDVTSQAILAPDYLATLLELNRTGKMLHALFSHYRSGSIQGGLRMHDPCVITWLARPELFTLRPCSVAVEAQGEFTSGTTVADIDGCLGKPVNTQATLNLDVKSLQQWVTEVLALAF